MALTGVRHMSATSQTTNTKSYTTDLAMACLTLKEVNTLVEHVAVAGRLLVIHVVHAEGWDGLRLRICVA